MEIIGDIWNEVIIRPMINSLVLLYDVFFNNFGLGIIVFTAIIRIGMLPLTIKQSRQMKAMSALQPKMKEIQAKFPNDRTRQSQETMALYKKEGVSPLGCLGPMIVQMPIFIGLFWALRGTLPSTPERLADLSSHLYHWLPQVSSAVPLDGSFLTMDLSLYSSANPAPFNILLPLLVGGSMWVTQKMTATPSMSPQQDSTNRMMLWMFPIMFGMFTLNFEAGLALYWIMSNVIGIIIQGCITGWNPLTSAFSFNKPASDTTVQQHTPKTKETSNNEDRGKDSTNIRRGNRTRVKGARRRARGGRNRRR